jgi:hypothetical protein
MRRFPGGICVLAAFLFFFAAPFKLMASSDPTLLSLVPPGAQVVAGMDSPPPKGRPGSFVLISHNNTIDLDDFYALTGADSSRVVRHAIFVAIADDTGYLREHGLMLSGHFDRERVYKSAEDGGAPVISYRGIPVLEIQPLARTRKLRRSALARGSRFERAALRNHNHRAGGAGPACDGQYNGSNPGEQARSPA